MIWALSLSRSLSSIPASWSRSQSQYALHYDITLNRLPESCVGRTFPYRFRVTVTLQHNDNPSFPQHRDQHVHHRTAPPTNTRFSPSSRIYIFFRYDIFEFVLLRVANTRVPAIYDAEAYEDDDHPRGNSHGDPNTLRLVLEGE